MLSNAYFLAKFRFDTAENEPAKNLQNFRKIHFRKMHFSKNAFSKSAFSKNRPRSRRGVSTSACMRTRTTSSMKALSPQPMRGAPHAVKIATRFASKVCFKWEAWNMNLVPPESTNLHICCVSSIRSSTENEAGISGRAARRSTAVCLYFVEISRFRFFTLSRAVKSLDKS